MAESTKGASDNERLLYAAKNDDTDLLEEIFDKDPEEFDVNHKDGQGNTALHYAALKGSTGVLEDILSHEDCDVDPVNYTLKQTPLHLAVQLENPGLRREVIESLLEAGADMSIKDKSGLTAQNYVAESDAETIKLFRKAEAANAVDDDDIASDDEYDGEDDGDGSDEE